MKNGLSVSLAAVTLAFASAACGVQAPAGADLPSQGADLTSALMVGDFHVSGRNLDEAFLFDGAVSDLSISKDSAGQCASRALQAKGGCNATTLCSATELLSGDKHRARIEGSCTITASKLTLTTQHGELAFAVNAATTPQGKAGFALSSVDGTKLNEAGTSAFFEATSRDPGEALGRSYAGGALDALTREIKTTDASLSPAVRAGLAALVKELSSPVDDIERDVTGSFAVFATPFDDKPVAYAVESTNSGDHCGGFQVFAVDVSGKRLKTELSDGDCGL
jgi:hypothetical protein